MKNQDVLISVVIPVYNQERYLESCLKSVWNQTYRNLEIICADDGSDDRTGSILKKWKKKDSRIHILELPHRGVSVCRNRGIEAASGEYVLFIDSDDYIDKDMIKKLYQAAQCADADMSVCGYYECLQNTGNRHSFIPSGVYDTKDYLGYFIKNPLNSYFGGPICKLMKKTVFRNPEAVYEAGEILGEDFVFNVKVLRHMKKIAVLDECLYFFRRYSEGSLSKQPHSWETAYRRGHCMLQEFFLTFRLNHVQNRYQKELQNFYVVMLRFLISHMMEARELTEAERRRYFRTVMDGSMNRINLRISYGSLDGKGKIIFFIYKHGLYRAARLIYRKNLKIMAGDKKQYQKW